MYVVVLLLHKQAVYLEHWRYMYYAVMSYWLVYHSSMMPTTPLIYLDGTVVAKLSERMSVEFSLYAVCLHGYKMLRMRACSSEPIHSLLTKSPSDNIHSRRAY